MKPQIDNPTLTVFCKCAPRPVGVWPSVWLRERGFLGKDYYGSAYKCGGESWGIFGSVVLTDDWLAGAR